MPKDILIVGAGLSGAVIARQLADKGHQVTVVERRPHIAGNAFDEINELGIRVHRYGPHLFHTSNMAVVQWLSRFTDWVPYRHRVKALLGDGRLVTFPVNRETAAIVGKDRVLDIFYRPYTRKMWSAPLEEMEPALLARVPMRDDDCEDYFPNDPFQALPAQGYTAMVRNMLDHPRIGLHLDEAFRPAMASRHAHVFNSMSIDEYFGFCLGHLPYRSLRFHHHHLPVPRVLPTTSVNFTDDGPFTRVTEWKLLPGHGENPKMTTLTVEEPCDHRDNHFERYYPIRDRAGANLGLFHRYKAMAPEGMTFIGRCGNYAYLDMHQAVNSALAAARSFLGEQPGPAVTVAATTG